MTTTTWLMAGITHPDDLSHIHDTVARAFRDEGRFEMRYRIITIDGETRWVWDQGQVMGKQTIAQSVESSAILGRVRALGVDHAQGYGIARPRPLEEAG